MGSGERPHVRMIANSLFHESPQRAFIQSQGTAGRMGSRSSLPKVGKPSLYLPDSREHASTSRQKC